MSEKYMFPVHHSWLPGSPDRDKFHEQFYHIAAPPRHIVDYYCEGDEVSKPIPPVVMHFRRTIEPFTYPKRTRTWIYEGELSVGEVFLYLFELNRKGKLDGETEYAIEQGIGEDTLYEKLRRPLTGRPVLASEERQAIRAFFWQRCNTKETD
jgi:hypothetical protein